MLVLPRPNVISCNLSEGAALLDVESGTYYSVNSIGHAVWNFISTSPCSFEQVVDFLFSEFDEDRQVIEDDLKELFDCFEKNNLIVVQRNRDNAKSKNAY
ncbi:PqqD family protein [Agrobacterium cavarae]|uniref:PqqD family protein n=1 Tax=Agrobacterium cavarae TaxID=2528239 RepID=UPI0028B04ACD|nr:PqqD family protein [Agrobacterium cavarae]